METPNFLQDKTVLIAGATSPVGRQAAISCAERGGTVIAMNRDLGKLNDLLKVLHTISDRPHAVLKFDIAASDRIPEFVDSLIREHGAIHAFIHSPGLSTPCPFYEVKPMLLERLFRINVISAFEMIRCLARHPGRPNSAAGVLIAPVGADDIPTGMSAYAACRGALISSMRVISAELAGKRIRINYLIPGLLRNEGLVAPESQDDASRSTGAGVEERAKALARGALALLSDEYRKLNGEIVMFDPNGRPRLMMLAASGDQEETGPSAIRHEMPGLIQVRENIP